MGCAHSDRPTVSRENEILLLQRLFRALLHSVRGDIAVIQNDLTFIATIHGSDLVDASLGRCQRMAKELGKLDPKHLLPDGASLSLADITELLSTVGNSEARVRGGLQARLSAILSFLPQVLGKPMAQAVRVAGASHFEVTMEFAFGLTKEATYLSLSSFVSAELGEESTVEAAVTDLTMLANDWSVQVDGEGGVVRAVFLLVSDIHSHVEAAA